jgi:hypothetical protein
MPQHQRPWHPTRLGDAVGVYSYVTPARLACVRHAPPPTWYQSRPFFLRVVRPRCCMDTGHVTILILGYGEAGVTQAGVQRAGAGRDGPPVRRRYLGQVVTAG